MVEDHIDREATELHVHTPPPQTDEPGELHTVRRSESYRQQHGIKKFWKHQVAVTVHHEDCRDHFGKPSDIKHIYWQVILAALVEALYSSKTQVYIIRS